MPDKAAIPDKAAMPGPLQESELLERLARFVKQPGSDDFDALAHAVFTYQYGRVEPFRRLCESRGVTPDSLAPSDWPRIPPVPVAAFQTLELAAAPAREVFRSSGTTNARRSTHYHPFPDLYRHVIDSTFAARCLPARDSQKRSLLSLVPPRRQVGDSSLGFMVEHVMERWGDDSSRVAIGPDGVDAEGAGAWAAECQRRGTPGTVLTTAFALAWWLDSLAKNDLRFELPPGSTVFETGGFKGRTREVERAELLEGLEKHLGISAGQVVREYGMTELTGHFYTAVLDGGDADLFLVPHFMRVRTVDPLSLEPSPPGQPGLLAIVDLCNLGSSMHLLTEDLGVLHGPGFRLLGRATDAELRGCSLSVEELGA